MAVTSRSRLDLMNDGKGRLVPATTLDPVKDRPWTPEEVSVFLGVPVPTLYQWRTRESGLGAAASDVTYATSPTMYEPGLKIKRERWGTPKICGLVRRPGRMARPFVSEIPAGAREGAGLHAGPTRTAGSDHKSSRSRLMPTGRTNTVPSSSGVRVVPVGANTDVGPCHGSQPRNV